MRTLRHALQELTDTRNPKAIRHPFSAMLTLIVYGLICGAHDVKAIWQKCAPLDQNQRHATGQPLAQRTYSGKKDDCELPVAQRLLDKDVADTMIHGGRPKGCQ